MLNEPENYLAETPELAPTLLLFFCLILSQVVSQSRHQTSTAELQES